MRNRRIISAAALVCAGLAAPAVGQDSVSRLATGLPGDGLNPWATDQQCASFVVTPTPFLSSWGNEFVIAPIIKSSKTGDGFFSSQLSTQGISTTKIQGVPYASGQYMTWSAPGFGVNTFGGEPPNLAGDIISAPAGMSSQFAVALSEFADPGTNNIVGAVVNFDPADPAQLYVSRIVGAVNKPNQFAGDNAQLGLGAIDAMGNFTFRADSFGSGGTNQVMGNNVFRVGLLDRACNTLNAVSGSGLSDSGAGAWLVNNSGTTHNVPSIIPEDVAGRPIYIGPNFDAEYVFEVAPGFVSNTTAHLTGTNHRGGVTFSDRQFFAGTIGTAGILQRAGAGNDRITIWGTDSVGAVSGTREFFHPINVTDNDDSTTIEFAVLTDPGNPSDPIFDKFNHHLGATAFRGGAQVAIGQDQAGRGLVAGTTHHWKDLEDDPFSAISVARFDPNDPGAPPEWTLAAWVDVPRATSGGIGVVNEPNGWSFGKAIYDGMGNQIGQLTSLLQVTQGTPFAPSLSSPFIDSVGNIYFLGAIQIFVGANDDILEFPDPMGNFFRPSAGDDIYTSGLIRAVYNPDDFSYRLELVFRNRDVFLGQDSDTEYQIQFLSIAAANSRVSPGTFWADSGLAAAWNNADTSMLDPEDPRTLGGLVIGATITYDINGDGMFVNPTGAAGDPMSTDESYNVLLFVGPAVEGDDPTPPCPWDLTGSGSVGSADLGTLLGCWGPSPTGPCVAADFTGSNSVGSADLAALLGNWGPCPQ